MITTRSSHLFAVLFAILMCLAQLEPAAGQIVVCRTDDTGACSEDTGGKACTVKKPGDGTCLSTRAGCLCDRNGAKVSASLPLANCEVGPVVSGAQAVLSLVSNGPFVAVNCEVDCHWRTSDNGDFLCSTHPTLSPGGNASSCAATIDGTMASVMTDFACHAQ